ncbi:hypothetical protein [Micromonospora sp. NPDC126480]|uniref:hypothetical protein n=1 Tax=Micromonospora sp. NPDC126480 TaxID=3155312 RepID=UPI0033173FEE
MARRGWGGSITTALGAAAGAGAAQLGFGYGLGIINWAPPPDGDGATAAWTASLIWATWIAATSTVLGAVFAQRLRHRGSAEPAGTTGGADPSDTTAAAGGDGAGSGTAESTAPEVDAAGPGRGGTAAAGGGTLGWIALAVAAGIGALVTVLLVAVPARVAVVPDVEAPRNVAAVYAALGVLVGVAIAVWALHSRAAATNVIATLGWLWLLAAVAVVDGVLAGRGLTSAQLGIWQLSGGGPELWIRDWFYWPAAVLSLGSALVIGALAARNAARYADRRVGATASGAAGPLLVAVAYLLAVPGLAAIDPEQVSAHLIAPYAVIVGLGGSALVATRGQRADRPTAVRVPGQRAGQPAEATDGGDTAAETPAAGPRRDAAETPAAGPRRFGRRKTTDPSRAGGAADPAASSLRAAEPAASSTSSGSTGDSGGTGAGGPTDGGGANSAAGATDAGGAGGADEPAGAGRGRRTTSTGGDATSRVPAQRTHETESTEESDAGGRRARPPRRTR